MLEDILKFFRTNQSDQIIQSDMESVNATYIYAHEENEFEPNDIEDVDLGYAEGQTFGIEYTNAKNEPSRRLITVRKITMGTVSPLLNAFCHNSRRFKCFRIDRIQTIFDLDGEVFETNLFLQENFGMGESYSTLSETEISPQNQNSTWSQLRNCCAHPARLLAALALSDGIMVEAEIDEAVRYLNLYSDRNGHCASDQEIKQLINYFKRIRPSESDIVKSLRYISSLSEREITLFVKTGMRIIAADQIITDEESDLYQAFNKDLLGVGLVATIEQAEINLKHSQVFGL